MYFIVFIISEVISFANGHFLFTDLTFINLVSFTIDLIIIIIVVFKSMVLPHHMLNIARKSWGNHLLNRLVNKPIVVYEIVFQLCCQRISSFDKTDMTDRVFCKNFHSAHEIPKLNCMNVCQHVALIFYLYL